MSPERAVDARAFDANDDTKVDANPFDLLFGVAICTPAIALVVLSNDREELSGGFFYTTAVAADVCWAGANGTMTIDTVSGVSGGWRLVVMSRV